MIDLKQYNAHFITYELLPGIYTNKDISEAVQPCGDHEETIKNEFDDNTMKTKLILTRFGSVFGTLRFDEKSFFHTLLGFPAYWGCKPTNAFHSDGYGVYTSDKILNLNRLKKIHLKCDVIDGKIQNGIRQPNLFSFVLNKKSGYEVFCEPETVPYKKVKKSV